MITNQLIEPGSRFTFIVDKNSSTDRLDRYITERFSHYSRSFFQRIIDEKRVLVNGKIITKSSTALRLDDTIIIKFPPVRSIEAGAVSDETSQVAIVASTDHFMIVYKPANLLVHAPSASSKAVTLADWVIHNHADIARVGIIDRPGIVHRLDKETSGILVITRTNYAYTVFGSLFRKREITKKYLAVVAGRPEPTGTITLAIGRNPINPIKMAAFSEYSVDANQKVGATKVRHARTDYKVLEYFADTALIEVKPTTGRTHQIRVHMTALGHPIIGDQLYGEKSELIDRQALHAHSLSFVFDGEHHSFSRDVPDDFQQLINNLRAASTDLKSV